MRAIAGSLLVMLLSVLPSLAVFGQTTSSSSSAKSSEEEKTVQIVLHPAPEPRPALKYQLLPPFLERIPGNAAVWWNRLPAERDTFFREFEKEYDESGRIGKWMNIPLGDPREKAYRENELTKCSICLSPRGSTLHMERAARFESCDWELPIRDGNFIAILLPEVQQSRMYARLLAAKAHLEMAEGKYDQAVRTLQVGYAEGRDVAQGQTIINSLVGVTIAGIMSNQVQQFIQQPDAPNLYWALSTLPRPLVDFRPGGEAESNILYLQFPELRDLDKKQLAPEEWRELFHRIVAVLPEFSTGESPEACQAAVIALAIQGYPRAKRYLIQRGRSATEVETMPVAQVILLYTVDVYEELSDEQFKWFFLPAPEGSKGLDQASRQMTRKHVEQREILPLASLLLPASTAAKSAETRCQWTIAMLRVFEAMRLYAAGHDGRWPDRLSDITEVPIPTNPCDGKPFVYERQGDKAVLTSQVGPRGVPWRYEITLMSRTK